MKVTISREALLQSLQMSVGVVERRHTLPILAHVLFSVNGKELRVTGTDLEVQLLSYAQIESSDENFDITIPARKVIDICRSLPEHNEVELSFEKQMVTMRSGRGRYTLATLPASEFPNIEDDVPKLEFTLSRIDLKLLIEQIQFAMAQQDVRYYLNGMLWEIDNGILTAVATNGHRLALSSVKLDNSSLPSMSIIIPRKGIAELARLLESKEDDVVIKLSEQHACIVADDFTITTKLIDGRFPDYRKVVPRTGNKQLYVNKDELKQVLTRTSILCNEKFKGVRFELTNNFLRVTANNPQQEEAFEELDIDYSDDDLTVSFNVSYFLDVLNVINTDNVKITLTNAYSGVLIESEDEDDSAVYVIMPMRL